VGAAPGPILLHWFTDTRLTIVDAGKLGRRAAAADLTVPRIGDTVPNRPRKDSLLDRPAHTAALQGKVSRYHRVVGDRLYEVEVSPVVDRRGAVIGTRSVVRSPRPAVGMRSEPRSSVRLSLELARVVAETAQQAAEIRTRKAQELQRMTEQAFRRMEAEERRARFLAAASAILDSTRDPGAALERLSELLVRSVADWWVLQFREGDEFLRAALRSRDPSRQEFLRNAIPAKQRLSSPEFLRLATPVLQSPGGPEAVAFFPGCDPGEFARAHLEPFLRVPVRLHGRVVGVLFLGTADSQRPLDEGDVRTAADLAYRIALARESSRLFQEAQREIARRKEAEARLLKFNAELERRVAERTMLLEETNREANSFAYTVAHDLRAPLRAITGFGQVLLDDYAGVLDETGRNYLGRIVAGARRMDELIRDLLEYSRLNRADISLGVVDLDELLPRAMAMVAQERDERDARVSWSEPLGKVLAQDVILAQVLRNLLSNAMKFVARGTRPEVRVSTEQRDGRVRIVVGDNGIGIALEHQERIFGMFERLNSAEEYPGTGMGLAIVRRAAERLGGEVGVESREGEGSRFWIDLPAADPATSAPASGSP
jgi:signal transduction histidine kinase